MRIALLAEGGYPYARGEGGARCDRRVRGLTGHDFEVYALGRVSKVASSARRAGPAASGACDRKAEGRPDTGCIGVIPTTRRACVPGVAGQAGLSKHALEDC
jgi:hypothetical protein